MKTPRHHWRSYSSSDRTWVGAIVEEEDFHSSTRDGTLKDIGLFFLESFRWLNRLKMKTSLAVISDLPTKREVQVFLWVGGIYLV